MSASEQAVKLREIELLVAELKRQLAYQGHSVPKRDVNAWLDVMLAVVRR